MSKFNFCIIAHIDHGKSTLADRLIDRAGKIQHGKMQEQMLDQMDLERERGITIKLAPINLEYKGQNYNLIDTPGHVDFQYEVGRSLAACEGAILLVDATSGVQAQTLSVLEAAKEQKLTILGAVNKIDSDRANVAATVTEIAKLLEQDESEILKISAKTGEGVDELLEAIASKIPPAKEDVKGETQLLVFDSVYDSYRGVVAYVRVMSGQVSNKNTLHAIASKTKTDISEVGKFIPQRESTSQLTAGDIGYVVTQLKDIKKVRVGDTLASSAETEALVGYNPAIPMVFASFFPADRKETNTLRESLDKLSLNDAALTYQGVSHPALGSGFRCGFLGVLHLDIVRERLIREFNIEPIVTPPTVEYKIELNSNKTVRVSNAIDFPEQSLIKTTYEPMAEVEIITPAQYMGGIFELVEKHRGEFIKTEYLNAERSINFFKIPLAELILTFHDELKSTTSGFGSMNYKLTEFSEEPLVRLDIMLAGDIVTPLSQIVPAKKAESLGRQLSAKLKEKLPKQNFALPIQATISGKIIARETLSAMRKDVTAKLYGGDVTRKRKLLEKQKKGKKRMAETGTMQVPPSVYMDILKRD